LADDIATKEEDKQDFIDSFRAASHKAIGGVIEKQEAKLETSRAKRAGEAKERKAKETEEQTKAAKKIDDAMAKKIAASAKALQGPAKPAALSQKEPEDFSADEKQAAAAVISSKRAADVTTNEKTLKDAITANIKAKQDADSTFRSSSSKQIGKDLIVANKENEAAIKKNLADRAKARGTNEKEDTTAAKAIDAQFAPAPAPKAASKVQESEENMEGENLGQLEEFKSQ